jgi:hypothetical protein
VPWSQLPFSPLPPLPHSCLVSSLLTSWVLGLAGVHKLNVSSLLLRGLRSPRNTCAAFCTARLPSLGWLGYMTCPVASRKLELWQRSQRPGPTDPSHSVCTISSCHHSRVSGYQGEEKKHSGESSADHGWQQRQSARTTP